MKRIVLITALIIIALTGCNRYSEIEIVNIKLSDVKIRSTSRAEVEVEFVVNNGSLRDLTITGADGFLTKERVNFAQFTLIESEMIERGKTTTSKAKFNVELLDPLSLFSMGLNINSWKMSDFEIDARGVVANDKGNKRVFKFKNLPLEKLIKRF